MLEQKTSYIVRTYSQVLIEGTWEDGRWEWDTKDYPFKEKADAEHFLDNITITNDIPIARLYKETKQWNGECYDTDEELLIEKS